MVLDAQIGLAFQPRAQNIGHQRGDFQRLVRAGVNRLRVPDDFPAPVDAAQELAAHPRGDDVHHVDLRAEIGDDALDGRKAAREHCQAARHGNAVALHHVGQILKDLRQIHAAQIGRTVLIQQPLDVAIELALVRLAAKFAQPQHRVAAEADVAARHAADGLPDELALPLGQRAHHAHIQPDDFAVAHAQVAGVRIGVKKAVLHDLPNVVIRQLRADFRRVVAARQQRLAVVDGDAVDALHHQYMRRGPFAVENRGGDERHVRVEGAEALKVGRLGQKIHFLLRDDPHLIQHLIEVDQTAGGGVFEHLAGALEQQDIPVHHVVDAVALHLDDDAFAAAKHGGVRLRDGGAAQCLLVKGGKDLAERAAIRAFHNGNDLLVGHRRDAAAQLFERLAVFLGQNIRAHGENLAELDERRPQLLDDGAELFGGQPLDDLVAADDLHDFHQALAVFASVFMSCGHGLVLCLFFVRFFFVRLFFIRLFLAAGGASLFALGDARFERGKLLVRQAVHRVQNEIGGIVGFIAVRLAAIVLRRDDV